MLSVRGRIFLFVLLFAFIAATDSICLGEDKAEQLWGLGENAYNAGRYNEAVSYYNKSLSICGVDLECVASSLNGIGASYEAMDDDKKAFKYYEDALAAARKINNRELIATNLFNTGAIYNRTFNQYEKALGIFEESLIIYRELNDKQSAAIVLFNMGKALNSLGRYDRALSVFNEALKINRGENNRQGIAGVLNLIGNVYSSLGQFEKPLAYYQEALSINRQLNSQVEIATTLRNIGDLYCDLIERDKAITYYRQALEIQQKNNFRSDMAITHTNMGALYKELDQYDKALSHYEESLKISRELDSLAMIATNLNNMGNVYSSLGKSDIALSYYSQALKLERQLNRPARIAIALNNIGMEYFRLSQNEKALYNLNDALAIEKGLSNPHNIAARLNNIGAVYLRQARYREAEDVFLERKDIGKKIAKTRLIHAGLVEVYLATKKYDKALALLKELPPGWQDSLKRRMEYQTQFGIALKGEGDFNQSAPELLKAVSIVEEIRSSVTERSEFFAGGGYISWLTPHRELMAVLAEMSLLGKKQDERFKPYGRDPASAAFYFAELTKARALLEMMAGSVRKYNEQQIPSDIRDRQLRIASGLLSIDDNREKAYAKGEAVFKKLIQEEDELLKQRDSLVSYLRKNFPLYSAINYPQPIFAEDLPLKDNEILIEYGISNDAVIVFVVEKGGVSKIHKINISKDELSGMVKKLIEPLSSGRPDEYSIKLAGKLYDLLLSDALTDLKDTTKRLIIIPDGILGLLPFEALVIKAGKDFGDSLYAGDKWAITYSQSATSLSLTRLLKSSVVGKTLFAIGNPIYDKSDPRYVNYKQGGSVSLPAQNLKQYAYRGISVVAKPGEEDHAVAWEDVIFPPLPETEDEIREIATLFGIKPVAPDILLGVFASETNFKNADLKDYRYLHFATHADLPGKIQGIKEPFIILGQVENKGNDDGFLRCWN